MLVITFFVAKKCKRDETSRKICDVYEEVWLSKNVYKLHIKAQNGIQDEVMPSRPTTASTPE